MRKSIDKAKYNDELVLFAFSLFVLFGFTAFASMTTFVALFLVFWFLLRLLLVFVFLFLALEFVSLEFFCFDFVLSFWFGFDLTSAVLLVFLNFFFDFLLSFSLFFGLFFTCSFCFFCLPILFFVDFSVLLLELLSLELFLRFG